MAETKCQLEYIVKKMTLVVKNTLGIVYEAETYVHNLKMSNCVNTTIWNISRYNTPPVQLRCDQKNEKQGRSGTAEKNRLKRQA
ncbi:hypothetical protein TNCT_415371 [Trichonephila clavata]|uniref:Uncharacterized protein n=1 Tax=Trichonephila clavata TaxID=2740835 RepID=A0A8X6M0C3_TRICU|nr:hypothetical protein TNCT_415371 [Trichonephila clavata]